MNIAPELGRLTWPEADALDRATLVVPLGSTEQHGPHLPLDTDTSIATALARAAARRVPGTVVAPALPYGASGEHQDFAGTLSVGAAALEHVLVELGRSALPPFGALVVVSGHGGNVRPVRAAVDRLVGEGRRVIDWSVAVPDGDAHAGRTETSLLLALDPAGVRTDRAVAGTTTLAELLPRLVADGLRPHAPTGVLGDPRGASAEEGRTVFAALVDDLVDVLRRTGGVP